MKPLVAYTLRGPSFTWMHSLYVVVSVRVRLRWDWHGRGYQKRKGPGVPALARDRSTRWRTAQLRYVPRISVPNEAWNFRLTILKECR